MLSKTIYNSMEERGCVFTLLAMLCEADSIPNDDGSLSRICSGSSIETIRRVLNQHFVLTEKGWYSNLIFEERMKTVATSSKRSEAGRSGASKRWGFKAYAEIEA